MAPEERALRFAQKRESCAALARDNGCEMFESFASALIVRAGDFFVERVKELVGFGLLSDLRQIGVRLEKHYDEDKRFGGPSKTWTPEMGLALVCNGYRRRVSWSDAQDLEKLWEEASGVLAVLDAGRAGFESDPACAALVEKSEVDKAAACGGRAQSKAPGI